MADTEEQLLIDKARTGDRAAFGSLIRKHQRRLYSCAIQMLGDRSEAEDAVQESFMRAFRAIDRFDGRSELSTWLYRICINVSLNIIRKRKRTDSLDLQDPRTPEPAADPSQNNTDPRRALQSAELASRLSKALDGLSPTLRTTVIVVLIEGVPQKDAAVTFGCSEGTVAWRIHEARRRLRESLGDLLDEAITPRVVEERRSP